MHPDSPSFQHLPKLAQIGSLKLGVVSTILLSLVLSLDITDAFIGGSTILDHHDLRIMEENPSVEVQCERMSLRRKRG